MMFTGYVRMAMDSIRASRWRSLLTMLGIIIGVASVVIIASLGEGVRQQVVGQINHLGPDLLTIRPGKTITHNEEGGVTGVDLLAMYGGGATMPERDLRIIQKAPGVGVAAPLSLVNGSVSAAGHQYDNAFIVGTNDGMPQILNHQVEYGAFFTVEEKDRNVAVIGKRVAEQLFGENGPIGRSMDIRGHSFMVKGVFEEFDNSPLLPNNNYNNAIFIPFETAKAISGNQTQIQQVLARPKDPSARAEAIDGINANLRAAHGGQNDFTILQQSDNLAVTNKVMNLLTGLITAVAALSLIVGGIGIMNIMLVSVSERTHEIGVRKAIGATNSQILGQFIVEAIMISFVGGLIGVGISLLVNFILRISTDLNPVITVPIMVYAVVISVIVGAFFGTMPALKAARKDPITALRQI